MRSAFRMQRRRLHNRAAEVAHACVEAPLFEEPAQAVADISERMICAASQRSLATRAGCALAASVNWQISHFQRPTKTVLQPARFPANKSGIPSPIR